MVNNTKEHIRKIPAKQGSGAVIPKPIKIGAATPYDFQGSNMTAYGGLLPVATMLEKLQFQRLIEEHVTIKRVTTSMPGYRFVLAMVLALYVGFSRLNHMQFLGREPMLTGILEVSELPVQSTFWRFLASLHLVVARQLLEVGRRMRQRVWEAAHVGLKEVTLDTDTTVQTVYGRHMGARKGYNPQHRGKKSYQPILTFLAETREYIGGELRRGERPTGKQIAAHLESVFVALPETVERCYARADSGFYCAEAVETYQKHGCRFVLSAQKTPRLVEELKAAHWTGSPRTDADGQCEFRYQPEGWDKAHRFVALRYQNKPKPKKQKQPEQYQLFDTPEYSYRVFVTDLGAAIDVVVGFYRQRAGAENLIKEANNDAGLAAHPSARWAPNCVHFQLAMLAYNLNCWLMLFNREEQAKTEDLRHTTLATARLRFLFLAAKIVRHAGVVLVRYSDHYAEKGTMGRLMDRLRAIVPSGNRFAPVLASALRL
ncbi:MAG TPA: IS1380 family transposase [Candidatus Sulfotelmatobacter sp.]